MRRIAALSLLSALLLAILAGCGRGMGDQVAPNKATVINAALTESTADPADVAAVAASLSSFATDLYQKISAEQHGKANVFLSPASIEQVLVLMLAATDGQTHQQLLDVLNLDLPDSRLYPAVKAFWTDLAEGDYTFENANWGVVRDTVPLHPDYVSLVSEHLGAEFRNDSFADPQALASQINDAVSERTNGMIKELVNAGMMADPQLFLVLLNAVYFKGDWVDPFTAGTSDSPFITWDGTTRSVTMMSRLQVTSYVKGDGYTAVELPYKGEASMLLVLPDHGRFDEISGSLTAQRLSQIRAQLRSAKNPKAELRVPKFSFTTDEAVNLKSSISALGAPGLFSGSFDWAPLQAKPGEQVEVGFLVHKAAIKVDEKGTEAAGATAGGVRSVSAPPNPPITFDRPFVVTIQDTKHDAVLFIGRIGDPRQ